MSRIGWGTTKGWLVRCSCVALLAGLGLGCDDESTEEDHLVDAVNPLDGAEDADRGDGPVQDPDLGVPDMFIDALIDAQVQDAQVDAEPDGELQDARPPCMDRDGDGFGDNCSAGPDCDDLNPAISPLASEIPYNGLDDDCTPISSDDDLDHDGYPRDGDCDDADPEVNPSAREITGNGKDDDCSPETHDSGLDWVRLPGGTFTMGSSFGPSRQNEQPQREVAVATFALGRAEVTNLQYDLCVAAGHCTPPHWEDGTCNVITGETWAPGVASMALREPLKPVVCVDWEQAKAFATWVGGRLPSEAEWEYAARSGGLFQAFPWGDEVASCSRAVINDPQAGGRGCGLGRTFTVCSVPSGHSAQGVCDLAGNAWEWVDDWFGSYVDAPVDGSARLEPAGINGRVRRGGGWDLPATQARASNRTWSEPTSRFDFLGFRVARSLND